MRRQVPHEGGGPKERRGAIRVTVKLFNLVAREAGRQVLARPVQVSGTALADSLNLLELAGDLSETTDCRWNGQACAVARLSQRLMSEGCVTLRIAWMGTQ